MRKLYAAAVAAVIAVTGATLVTTPTPVAADIVGNPPCRLDGGEQFNCTINVGGQIVTCRRFDASDGVITCST